MKKRFKAILGRVAALASALLFSISSLTFPASADSEYQMTSISNDVFRSILMPGTDHLNGYYLSTDGSYKPCTFVPRAYFTTFVGSDISGGVQNYLAQSSCLSFGCTDYGSDIALTGNFLYPIFKIPLNLHFGNVKECYYGCTYYVGNTSFYDYPIGSIRPYAYMVAGSYNSSITYIGANSSGFPNRATITTSSGAPLSLFTSILGSFSSSGSDLYISELDICCADLGNGEANISVIVPRLNNDYIIFANSEPPSFSSSSGTVSGTASENSSGGFDVDFDISLDVPDYSYRLDAIEGAINPSLDSAQADIYNDFDSEGEEYHNLENSLLDNMASQIDNMDSIAFEFDPTYVEEAEDFTPLFNYPLVMWMTNLVLIISLISFLIFGKWV